MNGMDRIDQPDALSEGALRRALRLETDEQPPRLDAFALAAAAERRTIQEHVLRAVRGISLVGISLGIGAVVALAALNALADVDLAGPASVALSLVAAVAQRAVVLGQFTAAPSVAVAALAAVLFAIAYERTTGREPMSVRAS